MKNKIPFLDSVKSVIETSLTDVSILKNCDSVYHKNMNLTIFTMSAYLYIKMKIYETYIPGINLVSS